MNAEGRRLRAEEVVQSGSACAPIPRLLVIMGRAPSAQLPGIGYWLLVNGARSRAAHRATATGAPSARFSVFGSYLMDEATRGRRPRLQVISDLCHPLSDL
jgi:hypothetical protein